ncbi:hypothetical protein NE237_021479 [Protea cynaroides]|uniref:Stress-response A/B barrel domain-containing protein n=1 Tax=Protea cynaroides TaxID=273540 RepID=A0A9Q0HDD8_9MAGN|nr:hypothetical protein NE237_021479 [Protea cynaroides]
MEEAKGVVKHIVLASFKEDIPPEKILQVINDYANLVNLIEPMKAFHWGTDVSIENLHQGFTHLFESTFESVEGVAEYVAHPTHVEFVNVLFPVLDKSWRRFSNSPLHPPLRFRCFCNVNPLFDLFVVVFDIIVCG